MNNFVKNKFIRVLTFLLIFTMISADVVVLADVLLSEDEVLEEAVEEIEEIDEEDEKDFYTEEEDVLVEESIEKDNKETKEKIEKTEPRDGEYILRHEVIGTGEVLYEESFPMEEGKILKGKERENHILIGITTQEVTEDNRDITFYYANKIKDNSNIKQISIRHIEVNRFTGEEIEILPRYIRPIFAGRDYKITGQQLDGYRLVSKTQSMSIYDADDLITIEYESTRPSTFSLGELEKGNLNYNNKIPFKKFEDVSRPKGEEDNVLNIVADIGEDGRENMDGLISLGVITRIDSDEFDIPKGYYALDFDILEVAEDISEIIIDKQEGYNDIFQDDKNFIKNYLSDEQLKSLSNYIFYDNEYGKGEYTEDGWTLVNGNIFGSPMGFNAQVSTTKVYSGEQLEKDDETIYVVRHIRNVMNDDEKTPGDRSRIIKDSYFREKVGESVEVSSLSKTQIDRFVPESDKGLVRIEEVWKTTDENLKLEQVAKFDEPVIENDGVVKVVLDKLYKVIGRIIQDRIGPGSLDKTEEQVNVVEFIYTNTKEYIEPEDNEEITKDYVVKLWNQLEPNEPLKEISGEALLGSIVTKDAPELKGYTIVGKKKDSIKISDKDNIINFYYIKDEELENEDGKGNAFFRVEHYKIDKKADEEVTIDDINDADHIETTLGKDRINNFIFAKDKSIDYKEYKFEEKYTRDWNNEPNTPDLDGVKGFVIMDPKTNADKNIIKLYYVKRDEIKDGGKEEGETSDPEKMVKYEVTYRNVNELVEGETKKFTKDDLNEDVTAESLDRFEPFFNYIAEGVDVETVRVYGQTDGSIGNVNFEDYVLLSKSPIIKTLEYVKDEEQPSLKINVLYASNKDDEIDEDLEKDNMSRLVERHILKRTVDGNVVYEDIIDPIVNDLPTGSTMEGIHSEQLIKAGYEKISDGYENLKVTLVKAGETYELRMVYEAKDETVTPPGKMDKTKIIVKHYNTAKKENDYFKEIQTSEMEVLVGQKVSLIHKKFEGLTPWHGHEDEIKSVEIPKENYETKYTLKFFYQLADKDKVAVTIKYISKNENNKEVLLGEYKEKVRINTYLRYEPYKKMFDDGKIVNAEDMAKFEFVKADPKALLVDGSNLEMVLEYKHEGEEETTKPKPTPQFRTVTIDYVLRAEEDIVLDSDTSTGLEDSKAVISPKYTADEIKKLAKDKNIQVADKDEFQLISASSMEIVHELNGKFKFIYVRKTEGELNGEDSRYFIRNIERLDIDGEEKGSKPVHFVELTDPITDVVEISTFIDFKLDDENIGLVDKDDNKLYNFVEYYPESGVLYVSGNEDEGFRIYDKTDDFDEDKDIEEPKIEKADYEVNYLNKKNNQPIKDKKTYTGTVGLEYKVLAEQQVTNDQGVYVLLADMNNPFVFELTKDGKIVKFNYKLSTDLPEDKEMGSYIVRHVRALGKKGERFADIIIPTENIGLVDSEVTLSRLTNEDLDEIFGENNPYKYSGSYKVTEFVEEDGKYTPKLVLNNGEEALITINRKGIQEVLFIYDFKEDKDTDIDPEVEENEEGEEEGKDEQYGQIEYTVDHKDNFGKSISKIENLTTPVKSELVVLRENEYYKSGEAVEGEELKVGRAYTLHSGSRMKEDFSDGEGKDFVFVYQRNVLAPMFDRFSVRYVEYDGELIDQLETHSKSENEKAYHETFKELKDLRNRAIGQGGKTEFRVNLYETKTEFDGVDYEYKGFINMMDNKFEEGTKNNVISLVGDRNNGRQDFIIFYEPVNEEEKVAEEMRVNSLKPYTAVVEYEAEGMNMRRIVGSDDENITLEPIKIEGYVARDDSTETIKLNKNERNNMPVKTFKYDYNGVATPGIEMPEFEEEDENIKEDEDIDQPEVEKDEEETKEVEENEIEKPTQSGGGGGGGGADVEETKSSVVEKEKEEVIGLEAIDKEIKDLENGKSVSNGFTGKSKINKDKDVTYITGYADDTIRPNENITRQEVAAIIYRIMDEDFRDEVKTNDHEFNDIAEETWSREFIATLSNAELLKGFKDGGFKPQDSMTRAELATIVARLNGLDEVKDDKFTDVDSHWAAGNINAVAKEGWINGYEDGTFRPTEKVTRAELITMINSMLGRDTENVKDKKEFKDLEDFRWYYNEIQVAVAK